MKSANWKDIAELIGIAAIVASLLFVGLQMRQEQNIASSQLWTDRNQTRADLASLIYTNPEIWTNGLRGSDLSELDTVRFEAMAFLFFAKESAQYSQRSLRISPEPADLIAKSLANMIWAYPGLKTAWSRWRSGQMIRSPSNPLIPDVESHLEQIESGQQPHIEINYSIPH